MAPASLIATPYTEGIHWGRPDPEQVTDLEAFRAVHVTARVSTEAGIFLFSIPVMLHLVLTALPDISGAI